jgi:HPt (histidine-containing phosphotransfer) domain-containing protein
MELKSCLRAQPPAHPAKAAQHRDRYMKKERQERWSGDGVRDGLDTKGADAPGSLSYVRRWWRSLARTVPNDAEPHEDSAAAQDSSHRAGMPTAIEQEIFAMLLLELPEHRQQLAAAHAAGDFETLARRAHKLHGAAVYCAVPKLVSHVRTLETAARDGNATAAETALRETLRSIDTLLGQSPR